MEILPKLTRASAPRIASIVALRGILVHEPDCSQLRLTSSVFGERCLHSLWSSVRELRTVAGHTITAFVRKGLDPEGTQIRTSLGWRIPNFQSLHSGFR
ncbi:hypothetical protein VTN00DRAFT_10445 [Thermoascus crustaceus]|uniref:uncharacterized protein n=1 Tax=Thermoascus crustaceus TaxID=5088 RepID=UPI003743B860